MGGSLGLLPEFLLCLTVGGHEVRDEFDSFNCLPRGEAFGFLPRRELIDLKEAVYIQDRTIDR